MAYWIQKAGNANNSAYRLFYCDFIKDLKLLPTQTTEGAPQKDDTVSSQKCGYGSECYCLEDCSVHILGKETNTWT